MSIADTLHDAVNDIDRYVTDDGPYADELTDKWIMATRDSMERLRCYLDRDLDGNEPPFRPFEQPDDEKDEDETEATP